MRDTSLVSRSLFPPICLLSYLDIDDYFTVDFCPGSLSSEADALMDRTPNEFRISHRNQNVQGSVLSSPNRAEREKRVLSSREVKTLQVCNLSLSPSMVVVGSVEVFSSFSTIVSNESIISNTLRTVSFPFASTPGGRVFIGHP